MLSLEEKLNTLSHAMGVLFGSIGLFYLLQENSVATPYATLSIWVYSGCFVILFMASTAYHLVTDVDLKRKLRVFDHISIYMLIAGTYTPVALIALEDSKGWPLFYSVWGLTAIGTFFKLFFTGKYEWLSLLLYLLMGWLIIVDFTSLYAAISDLGLLLLFLGGMFYTVGIVFYAIHKIPYNHFIWHLFVLAGAVSHWFFICNDII
ncbi:PAQR family membrane homeostasis protein TrhA [Maribacter sp. 2-571]|uniref:PAQR family membrane homeostasis protein TrhA n=1 Tax=Maribacter sp. 2-571 TaxID=3417569 RepID=UPI003D3277CB